MAKIALNWLQPPSNYAAYSIDYNFAIYLTCMLLAQQFTTTFLFWRHHATKEMHAAGLSIAAGEKSSATWWWQ